MHFAVWVRMLLGVCDRVRVRVCVWMRYGCVRVTFSVYNRMHIGSSTQLCWYVCVCACKWYFFFFECSDFLFQYEPNLSIRTISYAIKHQPRLPDVFVVRSERCIHHWARIVGNIENASCLLRTVKYR